MFNNNHPAINYDLRELAKRPGIGSGVRLPYVLADDKTSLHKPAKVEHHIATELVTMARTQKVKDREHLETAEELCRHLLKPLQNRVLRRAA